VVREGFDSGWRDRARSQGGVNSDVEPWAETAERGARRVSGVDAGPYRRADVDSSTVSPEDAHRARQQAGLVALLAIASQASLAMGEAATTVIPALPGWLDEREETDRSLRRRESAPAPEATAPERRGPAGLLGSRFRVDHLVRSSLYLMVSSGLQAALGFAFWLVMARLFTVEDVGRASSLISATTMIAYFALVGMNVTLVRFLPTAQARNSMLTGAFLMVIGAAAAIAVGYVLLTPVVAPRLEFIEHSPAMAAGFVVLTATAAVNLLTDSVFIASRKAGFCALTDGAIGGVSKIVIGVALAGTGAYGLFSASVGGFAAAALASVVLIMTTLRWRPSFKRPFQALKPLLKFSGVNYVCSSLNLLPSVVVPLIVLDKLGAREAGYYFYAFQMAALLYAAVYAVESAFLAEGSQAGADWRAVRRRSMRLAIVLFVPGGVVLAVGAHWVLLAFGHDYSVGGTGSLELLAGAVLPIAAVNWAWTVLQLSGRLVALVLSSGVYAVGICAAAWIFAPHGLTALSAAWPVGAALAAAVATLFSAGASRKAPARHRRGTSISVPAASNRAPQSVPTQ
jgi:O-antigen/teichoic acid export membrane protein